MFVQLFFQYCLILDLCFVEHDFRDLPPVFGRLGDGDPHCHDRRFFQRDDLMFIFTDFCYALPAIAICGDLHSAMMQDI